MTAMMNPWTTAILPDILTDLLARIYPPTLGDRLLCLHPGFMAHSLRKLPLQIGETHTSGGFRAAALMAAFTSGLCKLYPRYSIPKIHDSHSERVDSLA
mmetsp:Transcript_27289/g.60086  ORF Transcript_27289/g.60086 Transcript_27289/m.60086 type:complete len:99 (+) Transcript_27289:365-661(+)